MIDKHACSATCPCQQGKDKAIAERVVGRIVDREIAERVASRHLLALDVGRSVFTEHLKLHHFHGSLRITDTQNAGKRGKKVKELTLIPKTLHDELSDKIIKQAVSSILHMNYEQAKSHLEDILKKEGHGNLFALHEQELRGIDVEPRGTTIHLEKEFPDGTIVKIESSPHDFMVVNSAVISAPGKAAHGFRQDTLYSPRSKQDGILFYGWIKDNLSKAANMTILDLTSVWDKLGVRYDYH
jgi:hypothetical protein